MKSKEIKAPILERLKAFQSQQPARFHVPGHKGGHFFPPQTKEEFQAILDIDVTELTGLDDLHSPQDIIAEAQQLAARCFHAERTYFLVNGSTGGNLAMLLSTLERGDQILVQRNSHKSVFHGLALVEAEAILIEPDVCPIFQVPIGLHIDDVKEALQRYPHAKAIILTSPNYYGMISSTLPEIIEAAHQHDCLVFIDEAHGAHFGQHPKLPRAAMQLGADASVQSTHKMLSSLTMTSMLHIQGTRIVREDVEDILRSLQSSSPSYPLLASLDLARAYLETISAKEWEVMFSYTEDLRAELQSLGAYSLSSVTVSDGRYMCDPFKLTIQPMWELSGYKLQELLEQQGIYVEMADSKNVLLALPLVPEQKWNKQLLEGLRQIASEHHVHIGKCEQKKVAFPGNKIAAIQMRKYKKKQLEEIPIGQALGRLAAEMLLPYPPGIPLLLPNERITQDKLGSIIRSQEQGAYFQGKNRDFKTLLVVKE